MCGRYTLATAADVLAQSFELPEAPNLQPSYNIAPGQTIAVIGRPTPESPRQLKQFRWGLVPSWAKDEKMGYRLINARSETAADKPSFRAAFRRRRCLIVADGFYEWQRRDAGEPARKGAVKQPYYFRLRSHQPFAFAGLWEQWRSLQDEPLRTCTILTTAANAVLQPIHHRMPVILRPKDYELWLDPTMQDPEPLQPLLTPYEEDALESYPVSPKVNRPSYDEVEAIASSRLSNQD